LDSIVAISAGDVNGIGPEIIFKALASIPQEERSFILFGNIEALQFWNSYVGCNIPLHKMEHIDDIRTSSVGVWSSFSEPIDIRMGHVDKDAGILALRSIEDAVKWCRSHPPCPLITAPIHKESIHLAGSPFAGHTEMLASLCDVSANDVMMLLTSEHLNVGLVTVHIPISKVAERITEDQLNHAISILHKALVAQFGLPNPKIDILGLNPHAGDGGVIGNEEIQIISSVVEKCQKQGMILSGPYSADAYFGTAKWKKSDAVLAMYHDQGLIPFKMLAFESGVNTTLGLPFVRTSPDHGTAFDIAGKNLADPTSFIEAILLAKRLSYH
jgi:4-hydroxythreonine-4-phosphate dehydrogenase